MKKVIVTGNENTVKDLGRILSKTYRVSICPPEAAVLIGMLSIVKPELLIIDMRDGIADNVLSDILKEDTGIKILAAVSEGASVEGCKSVSAQSDEQIASAVSEMIGKDGQSGRKLILAIDDNPVLLRGVKPVLSPYYDVMLAVSGQQALTQLSKKRPDLILLDFEMPEHDGKETLEMIRAADERNIDIPVIFLTGVSDDENFNTIMSLGVSGYVAKPYSPDYLLAKIKQALM